VTDARAALQRLRRTAERGVRTVCSPAGLRGAGTEAVWSVAHLVLYPMGALREPGRRSGRELRSANCGGDRAPALGRLLHRALRRSDSPAAC